METTLTQQQLDNCLGSSTYHICHETTENHLAHRLVWQHSTQKRYCFQLLKPPETLATGFG